MVLFQHLESAGACAGASVSTAAPSPMHTIESRLGLPVGFAPPPHNSMLESPLAAVVPEHTCLRLSTASGLRFSQVVDAGACMPKVNCGRCETRMEKDEDMQQVEKYSKEKEADWVLVKKVSRDEGGGMVFQDRMGGFHYVPNV